MTQAVKNYLLYDGSCPVCLRFVAWSRLRDLQGDIVLLNARDAPDLVASLRRDGVEINDTMVLKLGALRLIGADAFGMILRLSGERPGLTAWILRLLAHPKLARSSYPVLVLGRKVLLTLLRIRPI